MELALVARYHKPPLHKDVLYICSLCHASLRTSKVKKSNRLHDKVDICRGKAKSLKDSKDAEEAEHEDGSHNMLM